MRKLLVAVVVLVALAAMTGSALADGKPIVPGISVQSVKGSLR